MELIRPRAELRWPKRGKDTRDLSEVQLARIHTLTFPGAPSSQNLLSVPATEEVSGFCAVADPKQFVGGTQMLLYG